MLPLVPKPCAHQHTDVQQELCLHTASWEAAPVRCPEVSHTACAEAGGSSCCVMLACRAVRVLCVMLACGAVRVLCVVLACRAVRVPCVVLGVWCVV